MEFVEYIRLEYRKLFIHTFIPTYHPGVLVFEASEKGDMIPGVSGGVSLGQADAPE